jgi:hypothetical protein
LAEVPVYSASGNPEILPGLNQHGPEHVAEIGRLFGGGEIGDFGFVRNHAQHRAEQRFPLEATLHAYRCGHRVLSQWLREAAIAVAHEGSERAVSAIADFAIEYTNTISRNGFGTPGRSVSTLLDIATPQRLNRGLSGRKA